MKFIDSERDGHLEVNNMPAVDPQVYQFGQVDYFTKVTVRNLIYYLARIKTYPVEHLDSDHADSLRGIIRILSEPELRQKAVRNQIHRTFRNRKQESITIPDHMHNMARKWALVPIENIRG